MIEDVYNIETLDTYNQVYKLWVSCTKLKHHPDKQNVVITYIYNHIYSINNREIKHDVCFSREQKNIPVLPSAVWLLYAEIKKLVFPVSVQFFQYFSERFI